MKRLLWLAPVLLVSLILCTQIAVAQSAEKTIYAVFWRGCMIAALNPKTLLFNAAFLPQFLSAGAGAGEFLLIAGVFLTVLLVGDLLWAAFATSARQLLGRYGKFRNRLTGSFLVVAGVGLALSRRSL